MINKILYIWDLDFFKCKIISIQKLLNTSIYSSIIWNKYMIKIFVHILTDSNFHQIIASCNWLKQFVSQFIDSSYFTILRIFVEHLQALQSISILSPFSCKISFMNLLKHSSNKLNHTKIIENTLFPCIWIIFIIIYLLPDSAILLY